MSWLGGIWDRMKSTAGKVSLDTALDGAAGVFADEMDKYTPGEMEAKILAGEDLVLEAIRQIPPEELGTVRAVYRRLGGQITRDHYLQVLGRRCIFVEHPQHYQVILRHRKWYISQMDQLLAWFGKAEG